MAGCIAQPTLAKLAVEGVNLQGSGGAWSQDWRCVQVHRARTSRAGKARGAALEVLAKLGGVAAGWCGKGALEKIRVEQEASLLLWGPARRPSLLKWSAMSSSGVRTVAGGAAERAAPPRPEQKARPKFGGLGPGRGREARRPDGGRPSLVRGKVGAGYKCCSGASLVMQYGRGGPAACGRAAAGAAAAASLSWSTSRVREQSLRSSTRGRAGFSRRSGRSCRSRSRRSCHSRSWAWRAATAS